MARQATKHALPTVTASNCHFPEPASPACLLLGLGGCSHAKCPCQGILGSLREPLCLPLRASLLASRLAAFGQANASWAGCPAGRRRKGARPACQREVRSPSRGMKGCLGLAKGHQRSLLGRRSAQGGCPQQQRRPWEGFSLHLQPRKPREAGRLGRLWHWQLLLPRHACAPAWPSRHLKPTTL